MLLYITKDKIFIHLLMLPQRLGGNGRSISEGCEYFSSADINDNNNKGIDGYLTTPMVV